MIDETNRSDGANETYGHEEVSDRPLLVFSVAHEELVVDSSQLTTKH